MVKIYTLTNPIDGLIFYVGATGAALKVRLSCHISHHKRMCPTDSKKDYIMRQIMNSKQSPIIELLDEVPENECEFWENYYISLINSFGYSLGQRKSFYNRLDSIKSKAKRNNFKFNHNA